MFAKWKTNRLSVQRRECPISGQWPIVWWRYWVRWSDGNDSWTPPSWPFPSPPPPATWSARKSDRFRILVLNSVQRSQFLPWETSGRTWEMPACTWQRRQLRQFLKHQFCIFKTRMLFQLHFFFSKQSISTPTDIVLHAYASIWDLAFACLTAQMQRQLHGLGNSWNTRYEGISVLWDALNWALLALLTASKMP